MNKIVKRIGLTAIILTSLSLCSFAILISSSAKADDSVVSNVSVTVPVSCNMSTTVDAEHSANINNGTYTEDIGTTTFKVFCNDNNGFSVYAIGYSGEEYGNTKLLATVNGSPSPTSDILTGIATSGNASAWAMKLAPVTGTYAPTILSAPNETNGTDASFAEYHTIPEQYTKIATFTSNTDFTIGSSFTTTYRAYIQPQQLAGTYQGKVKYTMVHPNDATAPIAGYTINEAYAIAGKTKLNGYYKMQDMDSSICSKVTVLDEPGQTQLIDTRDNKIYWVTKLQDGKCWMTQNLDHDIVATAGYYTHDNTDLGWGSDTATTSWTPVRATIDASNVTNNSIPNWANDRNTPYSVDPGNVYWNNSPFYTSTENLFMNNDWGSNPVKFQRNTAFSANGEHGHVGNYYNWPAAVATNSTSSYTTSTYNNPANNPQNSICPAGWRLPTISNASNYTEGSTNEFGRLNQLYNSGATNTSKNLEESPLYFVRSGYIGSSQQYGSGHSGHYWSSTVSSGSIAYGLNFHSRYVGPLNSGDRDCGLPIRCLAR